MSPDRQALLSLYHDDATALLDRALQAQHEPEGLHVVHAALVEALADAHTDGRGPGVSTTVPDETIAAIEARLNAATPGPWHYDPTKCWRAGSSGAMPIRWGESQEAVFSPTPDGAPTIALTGPANDPQSMADADLIAHAPEDLRVLLAEARRLTDANQRLTDLVRHQRGALHTEGLITDAEYADLAGLTGSPARLEGYDALRGELAIQTRAKNVAIGERDEARAALATARLDGARAMLDKVREKTAALRVTIGAVAEADTCPDVDMEDEIHDLRLTVDQIDALAAISNRTVAQTAKLDNLRDARTDARRWVRTAKLVLLLDGTSARGADLGSDG